METKVLGGQADLRGAHFAAHSATRQEFANVQHELRTGPIAARVRGSDRDACRSSQLDIQEPPVLARTANSI